MQEATHCAMTKSVVVALGWKGDRNLVACNAAWPDEARVIEVEKYGAHIIGRNLASLTHFCRPIGGGKYEGYCWKLDRSVPGIDLSSVQVIAKPAEWEFPVTGTGGRLLKLEPFAKLVADLTGHGSLQADEVTYSTAAVMAEWCYRGYRMFGGMLAGADLRRARDILAGWQFHLAAQDPAVPHHSANVLLDGHSAFEGDVDELYKKMEGSGEIAALLSTLVVADNAPDGVEPRAIAEVTATSAVVSPRKLCWYRTMWRPGWNKLVKACVLRGLTSSVRLGKVLMRAESAA